MELRPLASQLGAEECNSEAMVFAPISAIANFTMAATGTEVVRLIPQDSKAFLPRVVGADELIKYQNY